MEGQGEKGGRFCRTHLQAPLAVLQEFAEVLQPGLGSQPQLWGEGINPKHFSVGPRRNMPSGGRRGWRSGTLSQSPHVALLHPRAADPSRDGAPPPTIKDAPVAQLPPVSGGEQARLWWIQAHHRAAQLHGPPSRRRRRSRYWERSEPAGPFGWSGRSCLIRADALQLGCLSWMRVLFAESDARGAAKEELKRASAAKKVSPCLSSFSPPPTRHFGFAASPAWRHTESASAAPDPDTDALLVVSCFLPVKRFSLICDKP